VEALLEGDGGAAKAEALSEEALAELDERIAEARDQQRVLSSALNEALCRQHEAYHPAWGRLFKTGAQNSRWAQQVQEYACLYTSHVTNLVQFAPDTSFRALSDLMPHDRAPPV